jgi:hypothetical protein
MALVAVSLLGRLAVISLVAATSTEQAIKQRHRASLLAWR